MKKWVRVFLIVAAIVLAVIISIAVWQRNNISAVVKTVTKTEAEIAEELDSGKKQLEADIKEKYNTEVVSDFTAEEERKIIKGEISVDEAVKILESKKQSSGNNENSNTQKPLNSNEVLVDELIGDKAIELYSLKAYYLGKLGQMEAMVKKDYIALPKEKKNLVGKQEIVSKYIGTATSLLKQCDSQVDKLLKELEQELKKLKADTSIIKTIEASYENEKALKKAYYIKLLGD